jgi:hypothetical protein
VPSSYNAPFIESKIYSIKASEVEDFYDIHVFGTNNYISQGAIHHNSGKSYSLVMKMLKLSYLNQNIAGGILTPSFPDFKKDILPLFEHILDENKIKYRYHKTDKWFKFPWSWGLLYVFSAEKPIAGPNLGYCGINEFSLIPFERISEMLRRVRVKKAPHRQRVLVGTPEDVHGWLEEFIEKQSARGPDKFKIHYGSSSENTHIADDYVQDLESMLDPKALEVFRDGKIARLGGDYFYYSFDKKKNISEHAKYNPNLIVHIGLDFNVGYMAASFSHKVDDRQIFFDELLLTGDSNTYTMASALKELYPIERILITCDASGASRKSSAMEQALTDVAILKKAGYEVRFMRQNARLRRRQIQMNGLLHNARIIINPKCVNLIKDFDKCRQKPDFTKDEGSDKKFSHFSDGADYVCGFEHPLELDRKSRSIIL